MTHPCLPAPTRAGHRRRPWRGAGLAVVLGASPAVVLSGCAERSLVAAPEQRQGASTWVAVWIAGVLAAGLAGLALNLPAWRARTGSRVATGVLTMQTGAVAVVSCLLVGLAVRSWQLIERPPDSPPAHALVRLSRVDGDTALFSLLTLTIVVLGGLLVVLLGVATRLAASDDPLERWLACAVLGLEMGAAATLGVLMAFGHRGWPFLGGVVALPLLVTAFAACWPRRPPPTPDPPLTPLTALDGFCGHQRSNTASIRPQKRGCGPTRPARIGAVSAPPADQSTLDLAVQLLREAGDRTLRWFRSDDLEVIRKDDGTPVTAADRDAERFLRERLADAFPGDGVLGEEEPPTESTTGRRWILDPIDGTKSFTCGVPLYSNLLALEDEHGIAVGVINLPALGETVWAGRGLGCWSERGPARVSDHATVAGAFVMSSSLIRWPAGTAQALDEDGAILRTWGDGYGYALVATGRAAAMVDPIVAPYDVGPMPVILAEAGGRFTDLAGVTTITGGSALATNGHLHDTLLAALRP